MRNPIVTIVMPAFNVATHLDRSISSLINQTFADWELIVVDDCSTDNTVEVIKSWIARENRIRLIAHDVNTGPSAARNDGFRAALGQYIALLDADDAWHSERLLKMLDIAQSNNADLVIDNLAFYDEHAECVTGTAFTPSENISQVAFADVINSEHPEAKFRMGFLKPIFRKQFLENHKIEYWTEVRLAEDFLLLCESLLVGGRTFLTGWPGYIYTTQIGAHSGKKSMGTRTAQRYWDRVLIADRLLRNPFVKNNTVFSSLASSYQKWMYSSWQITEITALKSKSPILALLFALLHPRAAIRYLTGSRTMRSFFAVSSIKK